MYLEQLHTSGSRVKGLQTTDCTCSYLRPGWKNVGQNNADCEIPICEEEPRNTSPIFGAKETNIRVREGR